MVQKAKMEKALSYSIIKGKEVCIEELSARESQILRSKKRSKLFELLKRVWLTVKWVWHLSFHPWEIPLRVNEVLFFFSDKRISFGKINYTPRLSEQSGDTIFEFSFWDLSRVFLDRLCFCLETLLSLDGVKVRVSRR